MRCAVAEYGTVDGIAAVQRQCCVRCRANSRVSLAQNHQDGRLAVFPSSLFLGGRERLLLIYLFRKFFFKIWKALLVCDFFQTLPASNGLRTLRACARLRSIERGRTCVVLSCTDIDAYCANCAPALVLRLFFARSLFITTVRECYEAYVIYCFLHFLVGTLGDGLPAANRYSIARGKFWKILASCTLRVVRICTYVEVLLYFA